MTAKPAQPADSKLLGNTKMETNQNRPGQPPAKLDSDPSPSKQGRASQQPATPQCDTRSRPSKNTPRCQQNLSIGSFKVTAEGHQAKNQLTGPKGRQSRASPASSLQQHKVTMWQTAEKGPAKQTLPAASQLEINPRVEMLVKSHWEANETLFWLRTLKSSGMSKKTP